MFSSRISFWAEGIAGSGYINIITADNGIAVSPISSGDTVYYSSFDGSGTSTGNIVVFKANVGGTLSWQYELSGASTEDQPYAMAIDSSENIYVGGFTDASGQGLDDMYLVKYDSTGNLIWQKTIGSTATDNYRAIAIESGGNGIYAAGRANSNAVVIKYDNTGNISWQKAIVNDVSFNSAIINDGYLYLLSEEDASAGNNYIRLGKWYGNGTHVWSRVLTGDTDLKAQSLTGDSSNNIYVASRDNNDGQLHIVKYNSSGTVQWQIQSDVIVADDFTQLANDGSNVYLATSLATGSPNQTVIAKFDSNGTLIWIRNFKGNPETVYINNLNYANNFLYVAATSTYTTTNSSIYLKLKTNGSGMGTYGNYTYQDSTITFSTGNLTSSTQTSDDSDPGLSYGNGNLTSNASSFTQTIQSI